MRRALRVTVSPMRTLLTLSVVAGLALAGCESDDDSPEEPTTQAQAATTTTTTKKAPSRQQLAKRGERSLKRSLDANVPEPYSYEIREVGVSPTGWATVQVSGFEQDEQGKVTARVICGALIAWFAETNEKYANYGYVELMDGTRLGECEIGMTDIK